MFKYILNTFTCIKYIKQYVKYISNNILNIYSNTIHLNYLNIYKLSICIYNILNIFQLESVKLVLKINYVDRKRIYFKYRKNIFNVK